VEVYAIGHLEELRQLRGELERGPQAAEVSKVTEQEARVEPEFAGKFSVEHDG
jgi:acylphosphatase